MTQSFEHAGFTVSRRVDGTWFMMETAARLSVGIIPSMGEGDARVVARLIADSYERGARRERSKLGILEEGGGQHAAPALEVSGMGRGSFATLIQHAIRAGIYRPKAELHLRMLARLAEAKAGTSLEAALNEMLAFAVTIDKGDTAGPEAERFSRIVTEKVNQMDPFKNPIFVRIPASLPAHERITVTSILELCKSVVAEAA